MGPDFASVDTALPHVLFVEILYRQKQEKVYANIPSVLIPLGNSLESTCGVGSNLGSRPRLIAIRGAGAEPIGTSRVRVELVPVLLPTAISHHPTLLPLTPPDGSRLSAVNAKQDHHRAQ